MATLGSGLKERWGEMPLAEAEKRWVERETGAVKKRERKD